MSNLKISYAYYDQKAKDTILFLHGWGCNKSFFTNYAVSETLYNSLLVDIPGFGQSSSLDAPLTLADFSELIYNFILENQYKINFIIGHSFGGKVAVLLNEKLNAKYLILFAPSIFHKRRGAFFWFKILIYKLLKNINLLKPLTNKMGSEDYKVLSPTLKKTMSIVINENITKNLKKIDYSVFLIFGVSDTITPLYLGTKIKKYIKSSYLIKINGDHFAYLYNINLIKNIIKELIKNEYY